MNINVITNTNRDRAILTKFGPQLGYAFHLVCVIETAYWVKRSKTHDPRNYEKSQKDKYFKNVSAL